MPYERITFDLFVSDKFKRILEVIKSESEVARLLLKKIVDKDSIVDSPINYISISTTDKSKISYLDEKRTTLLKEKGAREQDFWNSSVRYQAKPGAFVNKLFKGISGKEVEKFSNLFRAESNKVFYEMKVVNGKDIAKFYHYTSYENDNGTLGISCMKHSRCEPYLDIYVKNKDNVSMLVMLNEYGNLKGRAILWNIGSHKIMDRIYTNNDESLALHFKKWATENGYLYKSEQNWYNTLFFENMNTGKKDYKIKIEIRNGKFETYPYMDTFKFIDSECNLYNYKPDGIEVETLCSTEGEKYGQDYLILDDVDKFYRSRGECVHLNYLNINTSNSRTVWSEINECYILIDDSEYDTKLSSYIFKKSLYHHNNRDSMENRLESRKSYLTSLESGELSTGTISRIIGDYSTPPILRDYVSESIETEESRGTEESVSEVRVRNTEDQQSSISEMRFEMPTSYSFYYTH